MDGRGGRPRLRVGARVLVIDADERVLLFSSFDEADGHRFWYPPGGACEPGESAEAAALRELHEETGLAGVPLGPELWRRRGLATWGGVTYDCRERWFLLRVAAFAVSTAGHSATEQALIVGHRWWDVPALWATSDRLVPGNLAALVEALLRDGPPAAPFDLEA